MTAVAPKTRGLVHIGLAVSDLDRAIEFYSIFGLTLVARRVAEHPDLERLFDAPGIRFAIGLMASGFDADVYFELFEALDARERGAGARLHAPGVGHVCIAVEDFAACHERLAAAGARFYSSPVVTSVGRFAGWTGVFLCDPDGNHIEMLGAPGAAPGATREATG